MNLEEYNIKELLCNFETYKEDTEKVKSMTVKEAAIEMGKSESVSCEQDIILEILNGFMKGRTSVQKIKNRGSRHISTLTLNFCFDITATP